VELQRSEVEGWVQCERAECRKWRRVELARVLALRAEENTPWYCENNPNAEYAHCAAPQELSDDEIDRRIEEIDRRTERMEEEVEYRVQRKTVPQDHPMSDEEPSDMGGHAIQLADGTDVPLQTSGIKVLADMETQHDDMGDGTYDNGFTPSRSLLSNKPPKATGPKTTSRATLVAKGQGKKPALKPAPKPAKSKSAAPHASGREPSGKRKGGPDTFAEGTQVGVARPSQP
jgi:hypothetical protein